MDIPDDAGLLRHVHELQWVEGERAGEMRPSSANFKDYELSVNWEAIWGVSETRREDSAAVIRLRAGGCRALAQEVEHSPIPGGELNGPNPSHADVIGDKKPVVRGLIKLAEIAWSKG